MKARKLYFILIVLLLSSFARADLMADIKSGIDNASIEANSFFSGVPRDDFKIITGSIVGSP